MLWIMLATLLLLIISLILAYYYIIDGEYILKILFVVLLLEVITLFVLNLVYVNDVKVETEAYNLSPINENVYLEEFNGDYIYMVNNEKYFASEDVEIIETNDVPPNITIRKKHSIRNKNYCIYYKIVFFKNIEVEENEIVYTNYSYNITIPENSIRHINKIEE